MNAYLSSTTLWKTTAGLFCAAPIASSESRLDGAFGLFVALAASAILCVAARIWVRSVERRMRERAAAERQARRAELRSRRSRFDESAVERRRRIERSRRAAEARKRREANGERRRAALATVASTSVVALGILTLLRGPANVERTSVEPTVAQNEADVALRNVADAEGTRWNDATVVRETEYRVDERVDGNAPSAAATVVEERSATAFETRVVRTAGEPGEAIAVEPIRAESSLAVPAPSALPSAYSTDWENAPALPTRGPNVETLLSEPTRNDAWNAAEAARRAPLQTIPQTSSATEARATRGGVVAPVYNERTTVANRTVAATDVAAAFVPNEPLIPFPSETTGGVAPVNYEERVAPSLLEQIDAERHRVGARVRSAVLAVETQKRSIKTSQKKEVETGCGFLFQYGAKIYLATNMHVVDGAASNKAVKIFLPGGKTICPTKILTCADFDLAALELDASLLPKDGSVTLCYFGDSDELRVSNFVGTVGNPFGLDQTVTYGHVSSIRRRKLEFNKSDKKSLQEFVQIDAAINPGNSGGPLYNARGEVVGVVAAIATTTGKNEGVAFAIPINVALRVLKLTIDAGGWSRSYMGVVLEPVAEGGERTVERGSKIVKVNANSPAEKAGLRDGDVVLEYDGEAVEDDLHLARLIALTDVGKDPVVKFRRADRTFETTARLERSVLR